MSETSPQDFDRIGNDFVDYYDTIRGYVRQEVTRRNLESFVHNGMKAIDIGGGDGRDSAWLGEQGLLTTLVDPSQEMLSKSESREGIQNRLLNDVHGLPEEHEGAYDLVLSHGVLMYDLDNPYGHLDRLVALAKPGGIVSLLTKGYKGSLLRLSTQGNWDAHSHLKKTHQMTSNLGVNTWAFSSKELSRMLRSSGAEVLSWSGVRIVNDENKQLVSDVHPAELDHMVDVECLAGNDPETKEQGQMLHFIAKRVR